MQTENEPCLSQVRCLTLRCGSPGLAFRFLKAGRAADPELKVLVDRSVFSNAIFDEHHYVVDPPGGGRVGSEGLEVEADLALCGQAGRLDLEQRIVIWEVDDLPPSNPLELHIENDLVAGTFDQADDPSRHVRFVLSKVLPILQRVAS